MPETQAMRYDTKDPAPAAPETTAEDLETRLFDYERSIFERFQALFALRNMGGVDAVRVLARALKEDPSALLGHEVAYVLRQMGDPRAVEHLERAILEDPHPMVRHEAVEALGNIPEAHTERLLRKVLATDVDKEVRDSAELSLANLAYLREPGTL